MTVTPPPDGQAPAAKSAVLRFGRYAAVAGVMVIAALGFVMSWDAVSTYAEPAFHDMAPTIPLMLDLTVGFASLWYVLGALGGGKRRTGWRTLAHAAVAATLAMNGLAGLDGPRKYLPLYLVGPAVWSAVVELVAKEALNEWKAATRPQRIDRVLWIVAPWESAATWLRAARTRALPEARRDAGQESAALELVRLAIPGWTRSAWSARHVLRRQVRSGALHPAAVIAELGAKPPTDLRKPQALQWRVLVSVLNQPPAQANPGPTPSGGDPAAIEVLVIDHQPTPIAAHHRPAVEAGPQPIAGAVPASASASGGDVLPASASASGGDVLPASASASGGDVLPASASASGAGALTDAQILAAILAAGQVPSTRSLQATYRVGRPRAERLRAEALGATTHPTTTPGTSRLVSPSVTADDRRSIPLVNGSSHQEAEEETQK